MISLFRTWFLQFSPTMVHSIASSLAISSTVLLLVHFCFLASLPLPVTATRAAIPYQPLSNPNILLQRPFRRGQRPGERRPSEGPADQLGNQIAFAPTCLGPVIDEGFDMLDPEHILSFFPDAQKLCASADFGGLTLSDGFSANMGGACFQNIATLRGEGDEARIPFFDMDIDVANPTLFNIVDLRHRCYEICECRPLTAGMHYYAIRIGQEQRRPVADISSHSVPGLDGAHSRKHDMPVFISDLEKGGHRKRPGLSTTAFTRAVLRSTLAGRRPMRTWNERPVSEDLARDILTQSCNRVELFKGPLALGIGDSSLAACLGRRDLDEISVLAEQMALEGMEIGSEERLEVK